MLEKMIRMMCMILIAVVVFLGGLLISRGLHQNALDQTVTQQEGSAL